jgi:hypothetical protein
MTSINYSGECVRNEDGSCTLTLSPQQGSDCGCANVSITVKCDEGCCSDKRCC